MEASHSSLDIHEQSPFSISFQYLSEQKIGPYHSLNGPTLDFEVVGNRNDISDMQKNFWR